MPSHAEPQAIDLNDALTQLTANRESIAWTHRRKLVSRVVSQMSSGQAVEPFRTLLLVLSDDPKPEVRKEVANSLATLPGQNISELAEKFLNDSHAYVANAAKQSMRRRKKIAEEYQKNKHGLDLVISLHQQIEEQHGKDAADSAHQMAEHLYDTLISASVHEMNHVMTSLKANTNRIIERQNTDKLTKKYLQGKLTSIAGNLDFLERMLNDMRNYARPVSDQRQLVSIADLVTEALSMVTNNLRGNGVDLSHVTFNKSIPANLMVKVSRPHIVAALVNVLKNACEFLHSDNHAPNGTVEINVSQLDNQAMIVVRDTGLGIPAEMLDEVRQCLPGRTTRRGKGTGFGLCNAQRNVMAHDGSLQIDSIEDHGTTVTLILSLA
jgi:signal transduction histidine kinase